jgi:hypothetical protein
MKPAEPWSSYLKLHLKPIPYSEDLSPDVNMGQATDPCTAGLTLALAGDQSSLYAVSLNAGVWKTGIAAPWFQLPQSPPRAYCIAVDPNDPSHVAVGEREDDAVDPAQNQSGLWESFDGGMTWSYLFDPHSQGCPFQVIPSLAFTPSSTLVIATTGGIFVKPAGQGLVAATLPNGLSSQVITAVVASASKVWARLPDYTLLVSLDDGMTWQRATAKPVPAGIVWGARGDDYSLGAFDSAAFMSSLGASDPQGTNNYNQLLIYDVAGDSWTVQPQISDETGQASVNGTGAGGRRFLKSYSFGNAAQIGQGLELFFCTGQEVFRATGWNTDGRLTWVKVAATPVSNVAAQNPIFQHLVHSEMWDFHWAANGQAAWVATDGGVFENEMTLGGWSRRNTGLHTHHVHTLTVVSAGPSAIARLAYATSDNDAWTRDEIAGWQTPNVFGDANWTDGDAGSPAVALLARTLDVPWLTGFNATLPTGGSYDQFVANNDPLLDDLTFVRPFLQFIQTPTGEQPNPLLDAVMLVHLPLRYRDPQGTLVPVPGPLGDGSVSGWALIRNQQFAAQPDVNTSQFQNWALEVSPLPTGTRGFWVSGGHANPVYYVYTVDTNGPTLYKQTGPWWQPWQPLSVPGQLLDGAKYGPAHVNPYNPQHLYVLTQTGVLSSTDGGQSFQSEQLLTSLLTSNGKYPFRAANDGYNRTWTSAATRANAMATLSHMAFNSHGPAEVVAASPFTGVFINDGDMSGQHWRNLTPYLPAPCAPISSVGIHSSWIYVGTEGRSVLSLSKLNETSGTARAILTEVVAQIILGIINDAGGVQIIGGRPFPVPPWGPFIRNQPPAVRDALFSLVMAHLASLISNHEVREDLFESVSKLLDGLT